MGKKITAIFLGLVGGCPSSIVFQTASSNSGVLTVRRDCLELLSVKAPDLRSLLFFIENILTSGIRLLDKRISVSKFVGKMNICYLRICKSWVYYSLKKNK